MKNILEYQLSKLEASGLSEKEKNEVIITCSNGVYEDLNIEYGDQVLNCVMEWNEGSFNVKISKEELKDILSKKPLHDLTHSDILDSYSVELEETKEGYLSFKSLNGIEDIKGAQEILSENLGFKIKDENDIDDAIHNIYKEGDIIDSEYHFDGLYSIQADNKFYIDHRYWKDNLREAHKIIEGDLDGEEAKKKLDEFIKWEEDKEKIGEAHYLYGEIGYKSQNWDQAINSYKSAVENGYLTPALFLSLGWSYRQTQEIDQSINAYKKAVEQDPECSSAYYMVGMLKAHKGKSDGAYEAYTKCLKYDENNSDAFMRRGDVLIKLGKLNEAKSDFEKCVNLDNTKAYAFYRLGLLDKELGKLDDAASNLDSALNLNDKMKNDAGIWSAKGWCELKSGQLDKAISSYTEAIKLKKDPSYHYWRGNAYTERGFASFAIEDYKTSIKIEPNFKYSYSKLAAVLNEKGETEEAERYSKKAKELE